MLKYDRNSLYNVIDISYECQKHFLIIARVLDYFDNGGRHSIIFNSEGTDRLDIDVADLLTDKYCWIHQPITEDNIDTLLGKYPKMYEILVGEVVDEPQPTMADLDSGIRATVKLPRYTSGFSSPYNCAEFGYIESKIQLYNDKVSNLFEGITIELKCCAYHTIYRVMILEFSIWVNNKLIHTIDINCGYTSVSYVGEDGGDDYCEKTDKECKDCVTEYFVNHEVWTPKITRCKIDHEDRMLRRDLVILSTPDIWHPMFVMPTIVINLITRKATIVTDLQECDIIQDTVVRNGEISLAVYESIK